MRRSGLLVSGAIMGWYVGAIVAWLLAEDTVARQIDAQTLLRHPVR